MEDELTMSLRFADGEEYTKRALEGRPDVTGGRVRAADRTTWEFGKASPWSAMAYVRGRVRRFE